MTKMSWTLHYVGLAASHALGSHLASSHEQAGIFVLPIFSSLTTLPTIMKVAMLFRLVQACHGLTAEAGLRSGDLSGSAVDDAVGCLPIISRGADNMSMILSLDPEAEVGQPFSQSSSPTFMALDLHALYEITDKPTEKKIKSGSRDRDENSNDTGSRPSTLGPFLENILVFVREHLLSKPLLMAVATVEENRDGSEGCNVVGDPEKIQEGFLMLCEVRMYTCGLNEVNLISPSLFTRTKWREGGRG